MRKSLITLILVFVCSLALIFITGCAKEQSVKGDVGLTQAQAQPSAEEVAQAEKEAALREQALKEQALEKRYWRKPPQSRIYILHSIIMISSLKPEHC